MKIQKAYCFDMPNQIVEYNMTLTLESDGVQELKIFFGRTGVTKIPELS